MRHRIAGRRLSRDSEHRMAMRRNMAASLFEHETISTTIQKAKEVKPFAEKLITLAKRGGLTARRQAIEMLSDREIVKNEDGVIVKGGTVIRKLFSEIGPRYLDRPGGYTRIIRLAQTRLGDNGQLCLLQLVTTEKQEEKHPKKKAKGAKKSKAKKDKTSIAAKKMVRQAHHPERSRGTKAAENADVTKAGDSPKSEGETGEPAKENTGPDKADSKKTTKG